MPIAIRNLAAAGLALSLGGCSMLASLYEERVLRIGAILLLVAAVVGFVIARMRRS
ncbi:hypothetical protein [Lysobacter humi (ex Lee et al. 2017)]